MKTHSCKLGARRNRARRTPHEASPPLLFDVALARRRRRFRPAACRFRAGRCGPPARLGATGPVRPVAIPHGPLPPIPHGLLRSRTIRCAIGAKNASCDAPILHASCARKRLPRCAPHAIRRTRLLPGDSPSPLGCPSDTLDRFFRRTPLHRAKDAIRGPICITSSIFCSYLSHFSGVFTSSFKMKIFYEYFYQFIHL